MTLQEKIDKLPLSIEYNGKLYGINFIICLKYVKILNLTLEIEYSL